MKTPRAWLRERVESGRVAARVFIVMSAVGILAEHMTDDESEQLGEALAPFLARLILTESENR